MVPPQEDIYMYIMYITECEESQSDFQVYNLPQAIGQSSRSLHPLVVARDQAALAGHALAALAAPGGVGVPGMTSTGSTCWSHYDPPVIQSSYVISHHYHPWEYQLLWQGVFWFDEFTAMTISCTSSTTPLCATAATGDFARTSTVFGVWHFLASLVSKEGQIRDFFFSSA